MYRIKDEKFEYYIQHPQKANWEDISKNHDLTKDQIRKAKDYLEWYWITWRNSFTEEEIREFADYLWWDWVNFRHKNVSESFLRQMKVYITKWKFFDYLYLSKDFRREFRITENNMTLKQFNDQEISEFVDGKEWDRLSQSLWITDELLDKFKNRWNWHYLSQKYWPIRTMWKFRDYWDWHWLTSTCVLKWKEYKIAKFHKYVDWDCIKTWTWKNWSSDFRKRFGKRLGLE